MKCQMVEQELRIHGELGEKAREYGMRTFLHRIEGEKKILIVSSMDDVFDLEKANERFGVRRWAHVTVGVQGSLKVRLEDQRKIGRQRAPGERTPAPLPDWFDLSHMWYEHGPELGLDPMRAAYQYLPGSGEEGLNIAESLHMIQPK